MSHGERVQEHLKGTLVAGQKTKATEQVCVRNSGQETTGTGQPTFRQSPICDSFNFLFFFC